MRQENLQKIEEIAKEFFNKAGFDIELEVLTLQENTIPMQIKTDNPQVLIGQSGQTLSDIQYLLRAILRKNVQEDFYIDIDVNNYKERKKEHLKGLALQVADEVSLNKKEKTLGPMSPYERRIVHLALAKRADVKTRSIGKEPERKIVIGPY